MNALERMLRWVVLAGIFALPFVCLIVATSLFFPYITGKNFAFRIIVELIAGAWLALALISSAYRPRRSWVLACFALFVLVIAIADLQGVNPFKSFWSNFERMDGWVTIAHLFLYFIVAISVLHTEKLWRRLFQVTLAVSVLAAVYGLLQVAGTLALGQGGGGGLEARVDATFGNPIYLAVYMLFHVFIAALLWAQMREEHAASLPLSFFYGGAIIFDTIALLFTGTRGTILGLVGGAVLALVILAFTLGSRRVRWVSAVAIVGVIVLAFGLRAGRDTPLVKSVGFLDRLATISISDGTVKARFLNMGIAWQGVKERPILGWGQENYAIVFDKYYDPRMYAQEPWFDRVHDIIFDWLIAGGFVGLLAYLSLFAAALWALWRKDTFAIAERSILTGLLAGYFVHNLTVFDNVTSYILFATVLGYIAWRAGSAAGARTLVEHVRLSESALPLAAAAAVILVWGGAWFVNAGALAQNRALITALSVRASDVTTNLELFKQAISYGTYGTQETREQLAQISTQIAQAQGITPAVKQQFFDTATHEMALQEQASPLDARFPLFLGIVLDAYGDYTDAANALARAHTLSPRKQTILFQMGQNAIAMGDTAGGLQDFRDAYDLAPEYQEARLLYAAAAIRAGRDALADQLLAPLIPTGEAADARIIAAYVAGKRFDKIVSIWTAHVRAQPQDIQAYFTLAAAYYEEGNSAEAIRVLQQAESVSPAAASQVESAIQQIKNGTAKPQ